MAKIRLMHATCMMALFAATPVLAQTTAPSTQTTPPAAQPATPPTGDTSMHAPAHKMHHSMGHMHDMHMGKTDTSQNAAVDQLNEQSYRAAQQGQSGGGVSAPAAGTVAPAPAGSGKM